MKHSTAEIIIGILLVIIALLAIYIIRGQNDIVIEQAYISKQIEVIHSGNMEIIERLNTPFILDVK